MKNGEPIPLREMNLSKTCAHIKELRSQNQLSRPAVAAYLGVSESALRNYETGRRTPSIETFSRSKKSNLNIARCTSSSRWRFGATSRLR